VCSSDLDKSTTATFCCKTMLRFYSFAARFFK